MRAKAPAKLRILVVDDDELVSETFKLLLECEGHLVTTAPGAREALALFRPASFDLVITDLSMPGMTGDKLAATIKSLAPAEPVILLTGGSEAILGDEDRFEHVDSILCKPLSYAELQKGIDAALAAASPVC